jgi:hypothetical protein
MMGEHLVRRFWRSGGRLFVVPPRGSCGRCTCWRPGARVGVRRRADPSAGPNANAQCS